MVAVPWWYTDKVEEAGEAEIGGSLRDPVVDAYKSDIDRSLLRENLRLTPEERIRKLSDFVEFLGDIRHARARQP